MNEVEALVRAGEIEQAAVLARDRAQWKRAAELFASLGRAADAVLCALQGGEWRVAVEVALQSGDEPVITALAEEVGRDAARAQSMAAWARLARRDDVAARMLDATAPAESARIWYERGEYDRAARCWERAADEPNATRAYEQHLAQYPDDAPSAVRLAVLRAKAADDAGAVRALQAAVRAGADDEAVAMLVCGLVRLGYEHGARDWIRQLRDRDGAWSVNPDDYADRLPKREGAAQRYAGRYRVVREAGSGATGRVLEAVDELTGDPVALKVLAVGDDRSAAFGRFMREAELARQLDDPTLVKMRALDPEGPTIVYDWMPGGTLSERIGRLTLPEVRAITLRLVRALETLHRNGVVHRDLKPSNVLFDPAGQCRLGDLGAAHLGDLGATVTGGLVGSLPYMAPEQITGSPVSAATDFYALGCVLFQMLTGRLPYGGPDFVSQHLGEEIPVPSRVRRGLSERFDALVAAMLAKDPDARPADAAAVRTLLQTCPWEQPVDLEAPRVSLIPSMPAAAGDDGAALTPSIRREHAWTDARLERDVLRVRVPDSERARLAAWAAAEATALQPLHDVLDDDGLLELRLEPLGERVPLAQVSPRARSRVLTALASVGVSLAAPEALPVAWDGADAVAPLDAVLTALGVTVETL